MSEEQDRKRLDYALLNKRIRIEVHQGYNSFSHEHIWEQVTKREDIDAAMQAEPKGGTDDPIDDPDRMGRL